MSVSRAGFECFITRGSYNGGQIDLYVAVYFFKTQMFARSHLIANISEFARHAHARQDLVNEDNELGISKTMVPCGHLNH